MNNLLSQSSTSFYENNVLPLFDLPKGNIAWQGYSELDNESYVAYFIVNGITYLLVNELHHGVSDYPLSTLVTENAVAPHEKITPVQPHRGTRSYITINASSNSSSYTTGDFSVFRIETT